MKDDQKTKRQLIEELNELRQCVAELKGFEEEIKQTRLNHEKFTKAFLQSSIPVGITTLKEGHFVDVSDAFLRLIGRNRDEVIGHKTTEIGFITEEQRSLFFNELNKKGRVENLEMKIGIKGGASRHGLFNAVMMSIDSEKYLLTVLIDITERKQAEEALQLSRERLEDAQRIAKIGNWEANLITGELYWSQVIFDIFGFDSKSFKPSVEEFYKAVHPSDRNLVLESEKRSEQTGLHDVEHRIIRPSGEVRFIHELAKRYTDNKGNLIMLRGTVQDVTDRKQAEEALLYQKEMQQTILDSIPVMVMFFDSEGCPKYVNSCWQSTLGWSFQEAQTKDVFDKIYPDPEYRKHVMDSIRIARETWSDFKTRRHDGQVLDTSWFNVTLSDGTNIGIGIDITERKRMEEALLKSKKQYDKLVANVPVGVYTMRSTISGTIAFDYVSPKLAEMFNASVEKFLADPQTGFQPIHPDDLGALVKLNQDVFQQPRAFNWEGRAIVNGVVKWFSIESSPELVGNGDILWHGVVVDVTKRKQSEDALRESESRTKAMLKAIPDLMFRLDSRGIFLDYVADKTDLYAQSVTTIIGKRNRNITPPEFADLIDRHICLTLQTNRMQSFEYQLPIPGRGMRSYEARMVANGDDEVVAIVRDITDLKRVEAEKAILEKQNRQLQKSESLGRMAGAIAHHFNNQLGVVIGNLELVIDALPKGEEPFLSLTAAMQASWKAAEMSGLMLTYLGQTSGKREPIDISESCLRSIPILRTIIPGKVLLETDLPSSGPAVSANANHIQQVLTNLVTNAWEAIGEDRGTIHLRVKTVSSKEIHTVHRHPINWQPQSTAYACLEVTDVGCGIAANDIEKLFDPFFSSKFTGRGMGLAVVMGIVRAHGGCVTVESMIGRGSTFRVFLPVIVEEITRQPDKPATPLAIEKGGTVLVVDDETMVRNMASTMLKRLGFSVLEAKDGTDAVDVFQQRRYDIRCVLCDLTMPRMNGWETLTALRKLVPDIPVILASGYDEAHVMAGDHPELPQAFIGKPYKLKGLSDAISQALTGGK